MDTKEFWRQYDAADKEHKKWEKRADKVLKRYRLETDSGNADPSPSFNILWANTSVLQPSLFSQVPKPDISRRYKDDDPIGAHGAKVLERGLEYFLDDGEFETFGSESVFDFLVPGRTVCKVRYCPTYAKSMRSVEVQEKKALGPNGEDAKISWFLEDEEVDSEEVQYDNGVPFISQEVEEVVDEHVKVDRWPWKNFRHQKAKRWADVSWVDYISFLDEDQLKKLVGSKAKDVELTVDATGNVDARDAAFKPTHAEVHEVWFIRDRKVRIGVKGIEDKWLKEGDDPLRLKKFYPTPEPLLAVDTNDSLQPIPLFTLYQHQANELDIITKRIAILMKALKVAGLYAGSEKDMLKKLFEADENQMIPVPDWGAIQNAGGVAKLVEFLPIEQIGKVLTALFREREAIVSQIFELTGIADIQRGSTDPRETKGSQVIKAQFASRRSLTPKQAMERYFRDVLRFVAEIMAEHFSSDTLERMTGLPLTLEVPAGQMPDGSPQMIPADIKAFLQNELERQYRIDIETDSTVAPDEERDQANMAAALEAVTAYVQAIAPLVSQGLIDGRAAIQLLKVYLRKFRWGREIEETLEQIERNPPEPKPDPEEKKMQMEMQLEQQKAQLEQQKAMMEMQMKQQELAMKLKEMEMNLQFEQAKAQQELQIEAVKGQAEMRIAEQSVAQDQMLHQQKMQQNEQSHQQKVQQQKEAASAKNVSVRQGSQKANSGR